MIAAAPKQEYNNPMNTPLTPATIESLQGRELDAAVAEWMGWTNILHRCYVPYGVNTCGNNPSGEGGYDGHGRMEIPYYSESPASMLEVENEIERRGLTEKYIEALSEIVAPECASIFNSAIELDRHGEDIDGHNFLWRIRHATPEQCAWAVLMVSVNNSLPPGVGTENGMLVAARNAGEYPESNG